MGLNAKVICALNHSHFDPICLFPSFLFQLDSILVKQQVEWLEVITGCETRNKYKIQDSSGRQLFFAEETTECCTLICCGVNRPFDMKIRNMADSTIIHLHRPLRCTSCCFPCCLQILEVSSPPGTPIGTVEQEW